MCRAAPVIGIDPSGAAEYEALHANVWEEVLAQIARSNIRNYSIYRYCDLLFSYYEYAGKDLDADLAVMAEGPVTQRWWALCAPLQRSVPDRASGDWWHPLREIFHVD